MFCTYRTHNSPNDMNNGWALLQQKVSFVFNFSLSTWYFDYIQRWHLDVFLSTCTLVYSCLVGKLLFITLNLNFTSTEPNSNLVVTHNLSHPPMIDFPQTYAFSYHFPPELCLIKLNICGPTPFLCLTGLVNLKKKERMSLCLISVQLCWHDSHFHFLYLQIVPFVI